MAHLVFVADFVATWKRWQAVNPDTGAHCLHGHRSRETAERCAALLSRPTTLPGTPQGAWDHAAGYPN